MEDIGMTIIASVLTGVISSVGTIKALHVHIFYLRSELEDTAARLDNHAKRINDLEVRTARR